MGHDWWIFTAVCAAVAYWLILRHWRTLRRSAVVNRFQNDLTPERVNKVLSETHIAPKLPPIQQATILRTNLTGYVPFCERAGLEASADLINEHCSLMVPIIRKYRGFIVEFRGDGILCCFGLPRPDDDHAQHAARAALEMQAEQEQLNRRLVNRNLPPLPLRIGIATGSVRAGDIGPPLNFTVVGEAVNEAQRLEALCKQHGGGILLSVRTASFVGSGLPLRPIPDADALELHLRPARPAAPTG